MGAKVFGGPKYTVSPIYEGMLKEEMDAAAERHPDVPYEPQLIDATFALLISSSGAPMVIPALNRDGDILSDLVLPLFGSIAGSESLLVAFGDDYVPSALMAEAAHGTAPALEGKDVANPMAMILAGAALLSHADDERIQTAGRAIREACLEAVADGVRTADLGGPPRDDRLHGRGHPAHADEDRGLGLALTVPGTTATALSVEFAAACESRSRGRRLRTSAAWRSSPRPSRSSATPGSRSASSEAPARARASRTRTTARQERSSSDAASASTSGADAVVCVAQPSADLVTSLERGTVVVGFLEPLTDTEGIDRLREQRRGRLRDGVDPAHHARAVDGRALVAGDRRGLQGGRPGRRPRPAALPDADDRSRHDRAGPGARDRRGRRGPAGDRDGAAARRGRLGLRRAAGRRGAGARASGRRSSISASAAEETAGGYATELTPEQQAQQQAALEERIPDFDVVITTAAVPGRPAPKLIPASAVERMRTGSVIVDLAAETGGNCEVTVPGEVVEHGGVTVIGTRNLPSTHGLPREPALLAQRRCAPPPSRSRGRARPRLGRRDHERRLRHAPEGAAA